MQVDLEMALLVCIRAERLKVVHAERENDAIGWLGHFV